MYAEQIKALGFEYPGELVEKRKGRRPRRRGRKGTWLESE